MTFSSNALQARTYRWAYSHISSLFDLAIQAIECNWFRYASERRPMARQHEIAFVSLAKTSGFAYRQDQDLRDCNRSLNFGETGAWRATLAAPMST